MFVQGLCCCSGTHVSPGKTENNLWAKPTGWSATMKTNRNKEKKKVISPGFFSFGTFHLALQHNGAP